jgi:hypothetical protein
MWLTFFMPLQQKWHWTNDFKKNSPCPSLGVVFTTPPYHTSNSETESPSSHLQWHTPNYYSSIYSVASHNSPPLGVVFTTPSYHSLTSETESSSGHLQWPIPNHFSFGYTMVYKKSPFAQS